MAEPGLQHDRWHQDPNSVRYGLSLEEPGGKESDVASIGLARWLGPCQPGHPVRRTDTSWREAV